MLNDAQGMEHAAWGKGLF